MEATKKIVDEIRSIVVEWLEFYKITADEENIDAVRLLLSRVPTTEDDNGFRSYNVLEFTKDKSLIKRWTMLSHKSGGEICEVYEKSFARTGQSVLYIVNNMWFQPQADKWYYPMINNPKKYKIMGKSKNFYPLVKRKDLWFLNEMKYMINEEVEVKQGEDYAHIYIRGNLAYKLTQEELNIFPNLKRDLEEYKKLPYFKYTYSKDYRGRFYIKNVFLNYMSYKFFRGIVLPYNTKRDYSHLKKEVFSDWKPLKDELSSLNHVKMLIGGFVNDKVSYQERIKLGEKLILDYLKIKNPSKRYDFISKNYISDGEIVDLINLLSHFKLSYNSLDSKGEKLSFTKNSPLILGGQDSTTSGLQFISCTSQNRSSKVLSNLIGGERRDYYTSMYGRGKEGLFSHLEDNSRKGIKKILMPSFYGAKGVLWKNGIKEDKFNEFLIENTPDLYMVRELGYSGILATASTEYQIIMEVGGLEITRDIKSYNIGLEARTESFKVGGVTYSYYLEEQVNVIDTSISHIANVIHTLDSMALEYILRKAHIEGVSILIIHDKTIGMDNDDDNIIYWWLKSLFREFLQELHDDEDINLISLMTSYLSNKINKEMVRDLRENGKDSKYFPLLKNTLTIKHLNDTGEWKTRWGIKQAIIMAEELLEEQSYLANDFRELIQSYRDSMEEDEMVLNNPYMMC